MSLFEFIGTYGSLGYQRLPFYEDELTDIKMSDFDFTRKIVTLEGQLKEAVTKCRQLQGLLNNANELMQRVTHELLERDDRIKVLEEERASRGPRMFIQTGSTAACKAPTAPAG
ncbi:hypothetical protein [Flaviaesturariibacter amylovorans]|uniref:Uncharacterized protein n=1 Tax=Flaviaesturariibacter amylovorans TaxID=1084520 RepID=A0ABP8H4P9_9BACT